MAEVGGLWNKVMSDEQAHQLVLRAYDLVGQSHGWRPWLQDFASYVGAADAVLLEQEADEQPQLIALGCGKMLRLVAGAVAIDQGRLDILLPHIRRVLQLEQAASAERYALDTAVEAVTSELGLGVVVLQGDVVQFVNQLAGELLTQSGGVRIEDDRVVFLQRSLRDQFKEQRAQLDGSSGPVVFSLPPLSTLLKRDRRQPSGIAGASVVWLLSNRQSAAPLQMAYLTERFSLSEKEARLAIGLAEGYELDQLAMRYHVSKHTLRAQLKSVFRKTQTHRQSALVKRLMEVAPLLFQPVQGTP